MHTLPHRESFKFSAGALALVVHGLFFSLLFFGFDWHISPSPNIQVEMWDRLPSPEPKLAPTPPPPPPPPPAPKHVVTPKVVKPALKFKADIELRDRKKAARLKRELAERKMLAAKKEKIRKEKLAKKLAEEKQRAAEERIAQENTRIKELRARMRADVNAAVQSEVQRYKDLIQAKIRRNIVMPPDIPDNAEAKFTIIVLPGGSVVSVNMLKSSGHEAYDSAAERAIRKAAPLPLPQDKSLARMFRTLRLSVKP